jgi:small subunit ribosomal protein S1
VCTGKVTSLTKWGAFVDIGGTDGLIHVSELSWRRIDHPGDVLKVRQEIEVKVLSIDEDRKRITLSRKALEDNPWLEIDQTFQEGQLVDGIITRLTKFGAFASIDGNELVEGLIHISEMSEHRIEHPEEVVREGEKLSLRIIELDPKNNRLRLSIKAVTSALYADLDYELHIAAKGEKKVSSDDSAVSDDISVTDRQSEETTEDKSGKSEDSSTSETQTETVLG